MFSLIYATHHGFQDMDFIWFYSISEYYHDLDDKLLIAHFRSGIWSIYTVLNAMCKLLSAFFASIANKKQKKNL